MRTSRITRVPPAERGSCRLHRPFRDGRRPLCLRLAPACESAALSATMFLALAGERVSRYTAALLRADMQRRRAHGALPAVEVERRPRVPTRLDQPPAHAAGGGAAGDEPALLGDRSATPGCAAGGIVRGAQPRVFLNAAGVRASSGSAKTSRWVPRRSKAQVR